MGWIDLSLCNQFKTALYEIRDWIKLFTPTENTTPLIYIPICEVDIPIDENNQFTLSHTPLKIGDSFTVNNEIIIKTNAIKNNSLSWEGDVSFDGNVGTLIGGVSALGDGVLGSEQLGGASVDFSGKTLTLTYFYAPTIPTVPEPIENNLGDGILGDNILGD